MKRGILTALKNGIPTACFCPVTASEITGNMTPQSVAKQMLRRTRLFMRKAASREKKLSIFRSEASSARRYQHNAAQVAKTMPR